MIIVKLIDGQLLISSSSTRQKQTHTPSVVGYHRRERPSHKGQRRTDGERPTAKQRDGSTNGRAKKDERRSVNRRKNIGNSTHFSRIVNNHRSCNTTSLNAIFSEGSSLEIFISKE
jgi:hypothetical protein